MNPIHLNIRPIENENSSTDKEAIFKPYLYVYFHREEAKEKNLSSLELFRPYFQIATLSSLPRQPNESATSKLDRRIYAAVKQHFDGSSSDCAVLDGAILEDRAFCSLVEEAWPSIFSSITSGESKGLITLSTKSTNRLSPFLYFTADHFSALHAKKLDLLPETIGIEKLYLQKGLLRSIFPERSLGQEDSSIHLILPLQGAPSKNYLEGMLLSCYRNLAPLSTITILYPENAGGQLMEMVKQFPGVGWSSYQPLEQAPHLGQVLHGLIAQSTAPYQLLMHEGDLLVRPFPLSELSHALNETGASYLRLDDDATPPSQDCVEYSFQKSCYQLEKEGMHLPTSLYRAAHLLTSSALYRKESLLNTLQGILAFNPSNTQEFLDASAAQEQKSLSTKVLWPEATFITRNLWSSIFAMAGKSSSDSIAQRLASYFQDSQWLSPLRPKTLDQVDEAELNRIIEKSYSQIGQDRFALLFYARYPRLRNKQKFFIEIGAADGRELSNTLRMEELGWKGICIEANPQKFIQCQKNRTCTVLDWAVYNKDDERVSFSASAQLPLASGVTKDINCYTYIKSSPQVVVTTKTLASILKSCQSPSFIEYLSIDVEGSEYKILEGTDFSKVVFGLIDLEHNWVEPQRTEIRTLLLSKGYLYVGENAHDDRYCHSSMRLTYSY
jgi:FkbM family methyltransferase